MAVVNQMKGAEFKFGISILAANINEVILSQKSLNKISLGLVFVLRSLTFLTESNQLHYSFSLLHE